VKIARGKNEISRAFSSLSSQIDDGKKAALPHAMRFVWSPHLCSSLLYAPYVAKQLLNQKYITRFMAGVFILAK
jgi:hypothetical protein